MLITGDMRFLIDVQRKTSTKDIYGAITDNWNTILTLKAAIKYISGGQQVNNSEIFNSNTLQVSTHFRDIRTSDIIIYNSIKYNILSIQTVGYKESLVLTIQEINT